MSQHPRLSTPLVGHEENISWFCDILSRGKLPHALLLQGPQGVGKATFAYHVARMLLGNMTPLPSSFVQNPLDPLFRRVAARAHGDLFVMEQAQDEDGKIAREISIASARSLKASFARTALEGGWRVGIVDSLDVLTPQGSQALLKLLEEPPEKCCLLLVHHGAPLLPTIVSRCQVLTFGGLTPQDARAVIEKVADEDLPYPDDLFSLYEGSVGCVLDFLQRLGSACFQDFETLIQGYAKGRAPSYGSFLETHFPARGVGVAMKADLFLDFLMRWIRMSLTQTLLGQAKPATTAFMATRAPDVWASIWCALQKRKSEALRLNFDPRHVLILSLEAFLNGVSHP